MTNTPIIELNSLEQTRLPNLNPSNSLDWNSLNPLPEIDNFNGLTIPVPPLESLENSGFDLPPLDGGMMYQDFSALPPPPPASISNFSTAPIPQTSLQFETNSTAPLDLPPPPPINQKSLANLPPIPQDKIDQITEKKITLTHPHLLLLSRQMFPLIKFLMRKDKQKSEDNYLQILPLKLRLTPEM